MTRAAGLASARRRVASMPSMRGMRRSMSTTSAARATARRTASSPSAAAPTTSMPGSSPSSICKPSRTTRWSSARTTRIGSASTARLRDEQLDAEAARRRRGGEAPAQQLGALAHAGQAVAEAALALRRPGVAVRAAVLDDQAGAVWLVAQPQVDVRRAGVAAHVRQRLLRGPVQREARLRAQLARRTVELQRAVHVGLLTELL